MSTLIRSKNKQNVIVFHHQVEDLESNLSVIVAKRRKQKETLPKLNHFASFMVHGLTLKNSYYCMILKIIKHNFKKNNTMKNGTGSNVEGEQSQWLGR